MTMRDRIRGWLGWDAIERLHVRMSDAEAILAKRLDNIQACSKDRHGEIIELLTKLEQHFASQHVGRPVNLPVYDWEQVQTQELAKMLANPPKEEN